MLLDKKEQLDIKIKTIDKTIQQSKGEIHMSKEEIFEGFDFTHNPYEDEARKRWGDKAVDQANETAKNMTGFDQDKFNQIFRELAEVRHLPVDSSEAQDKIHDWYTLLNSMGHFYSLEAFKGLGQMYVDDVRFTDNIDQFGDGLAKFMQAAMEIYADKDKG